MASTSMQRKKESAALQESELLNGRFQAADKKNTTQKWHASLAYGFRKSIDRGLGTVMKTYLTVKTGAKVGNFGSMV